MPLTRLAAGGVTVVVSTHDLAEAERFFRLVFPVDGVVRARGMVALGGACRDREGWATFASSPTGKATLLQLVAGRSHDQANRKAA